MQARWVAFARVPLVRTLHSTHFIPLPRPRSTSCPLTEGTRDPFWHVRSGSADSEWTQKEGSSLTHIAATTGAVSDAGAVPAARGSGSQGQGHPPHRLRGLGPEKHRTSAPPRRQGSDRCYLLRRRAATTWGGARRRKCPAVTAAGARADAR